jgi:ATP-dependent DNA ligase
MPVLTDLEPSGDNWQHEIQDGGYRTQLHLGEQPMK